MSGGLSIRAAALGAAAATAITAGAGAEEAGEITLAQLDQITVYATRNPMPAFDYPGQASVVGRDVIDDFNARTVAEIFDAVPGASIEGGPRRSGMTPSVRGVEGEGVLVLFDGARQSFLSGHDGRFFVDPELLQTVEVVRGPASALYGSGALGGVIAMRTATAADLLGEGETASLKLGGGYQSVSDEWRASATGAWRSVDGKLDVVGNVVYRNSGEISLGSGLDLPADDEIVSSLAKATARPTDALTASVSWIGYRGDSVDPNNPQGANVAGPGNGLVARDIDSDTIQGAINYAPGGGLVDLNIVAYRTKNAVHEAELDSDRIVARNVTTTGASIDNRSRFETGPLAVTFTYGGEFYVDEQTGSDNMTADGARGGVPDAKGRFYGAFAQAELAVTRPLGAPGVLTFIPGVRWDRFETEAAGEPDTEASAVSPKIGVSYKPVPQLLLFGNWAEAFRAPSFNEIYADGVHFQIPDLSGPPGPPVFVTNPFIANPDLEPEESQTWEVGAGIDLNGLLSNSDRLTLKGSYYDSSVTNLIDLEVNIPAGCFGAPFPPCGSGPAFGNFSRHANVTNAEISGVEIEGQYDSERVYLRANFSSMDGIDADTGAFVGVLSPDRFFADAGVKLPEASLRVGARMTIAGAFEETNDATLIRDNYTVSDLYVVWAPMEGPFAGLRADFGIDNVTDTDYEVVAAGVSQPGRNYKVALSYRRGF